MPAASRILPARFLGIPTPSASPRGGQQRTALEAQMLAVRHRVGEAALLQHFVVLHAAMTILNYDRMSAATLATAARSFATESAITAWACVTFAWAALAKAVRPSGGCFPCKRRRIIHAAFWHCCLLWLPGVRPPLLFGLPAASRAAIRCILNCGRGRCPRAGR